MTAPAPTLAELRRPRVLVRAARIGALDYRHDRDLRDVLGMRPERRQIIPYLLAAEADMEEARRNPGGTYSAERHISILSALIAESRLAEREPVAA